jgi:hypothetical protein
MAKRTVNPKRAIRPFSADPAEGLWLQSIAVRIGYGGNPMHKKHPGDFGLTPPGSARQNKILCDTVRIFSKAEATSLLREGAAFGLVSVEMDGDWPKNVWAVAQNGEPVEAILENRVQGIYHGYPMGDDDPLAVNVRKRWSAVCR